MPELVVEPAALQALARPLADVGRALDAVLASGVLGARAACGPQVAEALGDFALEWSTGLAALAASASAAGAALASVASSYDGVDARWSDTPFGVPVGPWVRDHEQDLLAVADGSAVGATVAVRVPYVGSAVASVLGVATLVSHAGVALYADGSLKDVALDVAGTAVPAACGAAANGGALLCFAQAPLDAAAAGLTLTGLHDMARRRLGAPSLLPPRLPAPPPACGTPAEREQDARARRRAQEAMHQILVQPLSPSR